MTLDHIVLAVADLAQACEAFGELTGCTPTPGGPHPGLGTHNALVAFAQGSYLEIIAPDPAQDSKNEFCATLAALAEPVLLHWALGSNDLSEQQQRAHELSFAPTAIFDTARVQPDGQRLQWQLMGLGGHAMGGGAPFFIDWCGCTHPSETSPTVGELLAFEVVVPDPDRLAALVGPIPSLSLGQGAVPALALRFASANQDVSYTTATPLGFSFGR